MSRCSVVTNLRSVINHHIMWLSDSHVTTHVSRPRNLNDDQHNDDATKGFCKDFFSPKVRVYYGSGWVGSGLTLIFLENRPKIALNQY